MEFQFEPGRLWHETNGRVDAEVLFPNIEDDRVWAITHTFVDPSLRGQGIAGQLIESVVQHARQEGVLLKPVCSYARKKFFMTPEYQEIQYKVD